MEYASEKEMLLDQLAELTVYMRQTISDSSFKEITGKERTPENLEDIQQAIWEATALGKKKSAQKKVVETEKERLI